jgi:transcription elongation factor GreA
MGSNPMTEEGFAALQEKLDEMRNVLLPELERRLGEAREKGDLAENAEYDAARERIWEAEQQKADLEARLADAFPVKPPDEPTDTVSFGYVMEVKKLPDGPVESFHIVGVGEGNFDEGRIAFASAFAQAFINHKVGETVQVVVPAGTFEYRIEAVRPPPLKKT